MGERLSGGNVAIALLANSLATGGGLVVLILIFGPVSGAHFNPAVTLAAATQGVLPWRDVLPYIAMQLLGAFAGVAAAHLMFGEPLFFASLKMRTSGAQWWSEFIATFGLLMVIWGCVRQNITAVPYAVAAYITSAYWFTASTSFANPAVTIARAASNTFAGIRPDDVAAFVMAQLLGAAAATAALSLAASPYRNQMDTLPLITLRRWVSDSNKKYFSSPRPLTGKGFHLPHVWRSATLWIQPSGNHPHTRERTEHEESRLKRAAELGDKPDDHRPYGKAQPEQVLISEVTTATSRGRIPGNSKGSTSSTGETTQTTPTPVSSTMRSHGADV